MYCTSCKQIKDWLLSPNSRHVYILTYFLPFSTGLWQCLKALSGNSLPHRSGSIPLLCESVHVTTFTICRRRRLWRFSCQQDYLLSQYEAAHVWPGRSSSHVLCHYGTPRSNSINITDRARRSVFNILYTMYIIYFVNLENLHVLHLVAAAFKSI